MKRFIVTLPAALLIAFAAFSTAQPTADPPEEPPVRLKKKQKAVKPEKPDVGPEKPDVPPDKPKPPKPRPKLEDDELDKRDDVKQPDAQEDKEDELMKRLTKNSRLSEEKLAAKETGESVRKLQKEIVEDLDRLIDRQQNPPPEQNQNQDRQNQQNRQGQDKKPMQGGSEGQQAKQERQQRAQQRSQERAQKKGSRPGQQSAQRGQGNADQNPMGGNGNDGKGGGDSQARGKPNDPDKKVDLWGHLPEKERALMNKEMEQKFMDKYEDLTKQYYRTIAKKSSAK